MPALRSARDSDVYAFLAGLERGTKSIPDNVPALGPQMVFSGWGGGSFNPFSPFLPGADYDYEAQAGDTWRNVAVASCLRVIADNFPQPELQVRKRDTARGRTDVLGDVINDHPLVALLNRPNPAYDRYAFWAGMGLSAIGNGNAYALKIRSRAGIPVELWWVPPWMLFPRWNPGGKEYIGWYEYRVNGRVFGIRSEDVIHWRYGIPDPYNDRRTISPLRAAAARSICSLNECDGFTASILRNGGVPTVAIEPHEGKNPPSRSQADAMKEDWREKQTGEHRGEPFIAAGPYRITVIGYSPEQLALDKLPARLEDQICALTGVNAMVAGLSSGANHKTFANYGEARKAFYEDTLIPLQARAAECLEHQLLGDFGIGDPETETIAFSYSGIPCLQEDQDRVWTRAINAYQGQVITRAQAKDLIGLDHDETDEVYMGPQGTTIPADPEKAAQEEAERRAVAQAIADAQAQPVESAGNETPPAAEEEEVSAKALGPVVARVLHRLDERLALPDLSADRLPPWKADEVHGAAANGAA